MEVCRWGMEKKTRKRRTHKLDRGGRACPTAQVLRQPFWERWMGHKFVVASTVWGHDWNDHLNSITVRGIIFAALRRLPERGAFPLIVLVFSRFQSFQEFETQLTPSRRSKNGSDECGPWHTARAEQIEINHKCGAPPEPTMHALHCPPGPRPRICWQPNRRGSHGHCLPRGRTKTHIARLIVSISSSSSSS